MGQAFSVMGPQGDPHEMLRAATLSIEVGPSHDRTVGTGFFVAPGIVATCAHVVAPTLGTLPATLSGRAADGRVLALTAVPGWYLRTEPGGLDLAFLRALSSIDTPHVLTSPEAEVGDAMWTFGHPAGRFRLGQPASFVYQGTSKMATLNEPDQPAVASWEPGRVVGTPVGGGYSGSPVLNERTGAVVGMLTTSDEAGSAHMVAVSDIVEALPEVRAAHHVLTAHSAWLESLTDEQIRAGRWPFPGPRLRSYLHAARRAARYHPFPGVVSDAAHPPLAAVYLKQQVLAGEAEDGADADGADAPNRPDTVPAETVLALNQDCVIVAGPGAGKSSLLRTGLIDLVERWRDQASAPVVPVRVLAADLHAKSTIPEAMAQSTNDDFSLLGLIEAWTPEFFTTAPLPGVPWLVLVDGLDELADPRARRTVLGKIAGMRNRGHPSPYRFVIATRPLPDGELDLPDWHADRYELQSFRPDDLPVFAAAWFKQLMVSDSDGAVRVFTGKLQRSGLAELARIPLMATILCQLHARDPGRELPGGRAEVYRRFAELLDERQRSGKTGIRSEVRASLAERGAAALAAADRVLDESRTMIERLAMARRAGDSQPAVVLLEIWTRPYRPPHIADDVWTGFLRNVLRRSGLLTERLGDFVFLHQSLMEYLAACHVAAAEATTGAAIGSAVFDEMLGWWSRPRPWRRKIWNPPRMEGSYVGFLIDAWPDQEAVSTALARIVGEAGLAGCQFVAARVKEGTRIDSAVVAAAVMTLAALQGQQRWPAANALTDLGDVRGADFFVEVAGDTAALSRFRWRAAERLESIGDPRSDEVFTQLASDLTVGEVFRIRAQRRLGVSDPRVADTGRRTNRFAAAGKYPYPEVLAARAADPRVGHSERRRSAVRLAEIDDPRGAPLLFALATDATLDIENRWLAAEKLDELGDPRTLAWLHARESDQLMATAARWVPWMSRLRTST